MRIAIKADTRFRTDRPGMSRSAGMARPAKAITTMSAVPIAVGGRRNSPSADSDGVMIAATVSTLSRTLSLQWSGVPLSGSPFIIPRLTVSDRGRSGDIIPSNGRDAGTAG